MHRPSSRRVVLTATACLLVSCLDGPTSPIAKRSVGEPSHAFSGRSALRIDFEALAVGDSALLHFKSDGCFHHLAADVLLTRKASGLALRLVSTTGNLMPGARIETVGTLSLEDVRALDRTLGYYRSGPPGGCTTVDRITIERFDGARAEAYVDASCGTYEAHDALPISRLFHMVRDSARTGAT